MYKWVLYLDESGNTGTNVFDEDQPFYVYAGWLIKKEDESNIVNYVKESFKTVKSKELKSTIVLKKYRPQLYEFLKKSMKNKMFPFYYVFEKKHYVCCKVVETFFDYAHNSNVPMELTVDFERKKEICNAIYDNEELLILFSELISDATITIEKMQQIKELLSNSMNSVQMKTYRNMISNITNEEMKMMVDEFECIAEENSRIRQSPGGTELFSIVYEVEKLMKAVDETAIIVVDELSKRTFINDIKRIIDNRSIFIKVADLKTENSKENIIIQAADLLSGFINAIFKNDLRIINDKESKEIITLFDIYNKQCLKYGVSPLNFSSYVQ